MNKTVRAVLGFLGFFAGVGILMSDRFQDIRDAVPESLYYWAFVVLLAGMTVLGLYAWWQHYNGRKMDSTVGRLKKWLDSNHWPI